MSNSKLFANAGSQHYSLPEEDPLYYHPSHTTQGDPQEQQPRDRDYDDDHTAGATPDDDANECDNSNKNQQEDQHASQLSQINKEEAHSLRSWIYCEALSTPFRPSQLS